MSKKKPARLDPHATVFRTALLSFLKKPRTLLGLAEAMQCSQAEIKTALKSLKGSGYALHEHKGHVSLNRTSTAESTPEGVKAVSLSLSKCGAPTKIGIISDTHLGSRRAREDLLHAAYDSFAKAGIDKVFHAGNMVEGEASFNRYELKVHGVTDQTLYALEHYPKRKGITTYFIDGDDHEGWWYQREGIRFGSYLTTLARDYDRPDLVYLGYAEADVELRGLRADGRRRFMRILHPGGGSAYAISYQPQKIIESYGPNEKPDILVIGHFHKMGYFRPRSIHCILAGCTQDQTVFMRKKRIEAHLGWWHLGISQDAKGASVALDCRAFMGFDSAYYGVDHVQAAGLAG